MVCGSDKTGPENCSTIKKNALSRTEICCREMAVNKYTTLSITSIAGDVFTDGWL